MFFLFTYVFLFVYKHTKLNRFVSVTWHCFLHSLRCSRAVSYTKLLLCMDDIVGDTVMKQAWRLHEQ